MKQACERSELLKHLELYVKEKTCKSLYDREIVLFGAHVRGVRFLEAFPSVRPMYFVDSDLMKQGQELNGVIVKNPRVLQREDKDVLVIITSSREKEIKMQLRSMSLGANIELLFCPTFELPSINFNGDYYYGDYAESYDEVRSSNQDYWEEEFQVTKSFLKLSQVKTILDVPFGTGRFAELYKSLGCTAIGFEKSTDMIKVANRKLLDLDLDWSIDCGDASCLPYQDRSFDMVVCMRFLPVIVPWKVARSALEEFSRVSSRYMLLNLWERSPSLPIKRIADDNEFMGWNFDSVQLESLINKLGFSVIAKKKLNMRLLMGTNMIYLVERKN